MKQRGHGYPSGSASGATLIEVVITIGILITTLVPLIGLLSVAVDTSGKAASTTISSRIAARLIGDLQQSDWAGLQAWQSRELYFDDQGRELTGANETQQAVYVTRVKLGPAGGVSMGIQAAANTSLRQVTVLVASGSVALGKAELDAAESALANGKEVPKGVRLSRAMLVNLEKPTGL